MNSDSTVKGIGMQRSLRLSALLTKATRKCTVCKRALDLLLLQIREMHMRTVIGGTGLNTQCKKLIVSSSSNRNVIRITIYDLLRYIFSRKFGGSDCTMLIYVPLLSVVFTINFFCTLEAPDFSRFGEYYLLTK